jgi:hypothetical protein
MSDTDFKPVLVGLKGKSVCTLKQLQDSSQRFPLDHSFRFFLPRVSPKRANTRNQFERTVRQLGTRGKADIRFTPSIETLDGGDARVTIHVSGADESGKTLSAERYVAHVSWDDDNAHIDDIAIQDFGGNNENKQRILNALYEAEGVINSTQWVKAWERLHGSHDSYDFKGNTFLVRSQEGLDDFTSFKDIAVECGIWCWRADEPVDLIALDLEAKMKELLEEAQEKLASNDKITSRSYLNKAKQIDETVDFIHQLRATMGLIGTHLDPLIEQAKSAWQELEKKHTAIVQTYYTLSEEGEQFLAFLRQHELYPFTNMEEGVIVNILNRIADSAEGIAESDLSTNTEAWTQLVDRSLVASSER